MSKEQPSNQEMTILTLLWDNGPMTARQVLENMPDGKKRAYTSVLSVMQVMEKKGFISHYKEGVANIYQAVIERKAVIPSLLNKMVSNLFGGSKVTLMQQLLDKDVDQQELDEIKQIIANLEDK